MRSTFLSKRRSGLPPSLKSVNFSVLSEQTTRSIGVPKYVTGWITEKQTEGKVCLETFRLASNQTSYHLDALSAVTE